MHLLPKPLPKSASHEPIKQTSAVANILGNIYVYRAYESVFFMLSTSRDTILPFLEIGEHCREFNCRKLEKLHKTAEN